MANPSKTLANILAVIDKDVKRIKRAGRDLQLEPEDALTLTRYAAALDSIVKSTEKESEKAKRQLEKLPTEKLIEEYQKEQKK